MKQKLKIFYQNNRGKIYIVVSVLIALGMAQVINFTINCYQKTAEFISNPIPVYAMAEVNINNGIKEYKYNDKVPVEVVIKEIKKQSKEFGVDEKFMIDLAFCESSYNNLAKNPDSTALGIYQWLIKSWEATDSFKQHKIARTDYKANILEAMIKIKNKEYSHWASCIK